MIDINQNALIRIINTWLFQIRNNFSSSGQMLRERFVSETNDSKKMSALSFVARKKNRRLMVVIWRRQEMREKVELKQPRGSKLDGVFREPYN